MHTNHLSFKSFKSLFLLLIAVFALSNAYALSVTTTTGNIQITTKCTALGGAVGYTVYTQPFTISITGNGVSKSSNFAYSNVVGKSVTAGTVSGLAPGTYTLSITQQPAESSAGWIYAQEISTADISSNAAPTASITLSTGNTYTGTPVTVTAIATDADSNLIATALDWSTDNSNWNQSVASWSGASTNTNTLTYTLTPTATGTVYFRMKGTDSLGATSSYATTTLSVTNAPVVPPSVPQLNGTLTGYPSTTATGTVVSLTGSINGFDTKTAATFMGTTESVAAQSTMYARIFYKSPDGVWNSTAYSPINISSLSNSSVITTTANIPVSLPGTYQWYLAGGATTSPSTQLPTSGSVGTVTATGNTSLKTMWSDTALQPKPVLESGVDYYSKKPWSRYKSDYADNTQPTNIGAALSFSYLQPTIGQTIKTPLGDIVQTATDGTGTTTFTLPYACTVAVTCYVVMPGGNWTHSGEVTIDNNVILDANTGSSSVGFSSYLGYLYDDCFPGPGPYSRYAMKSGNGFGSDLTGLTSFSIANLWRRMNLDLSAGMHTVRVTRPGGFTSAGFHPQFLLLMVPVPTSNQTGSGRDIILAQGSTTVADTVVGSISLKTVGSGNLSGVLKKTFKANIQSSSGKLSDFGSYLTDQINGSTLAAAAKSDLIAGLGTVATQLANGSTQTINTSYGVFSLQSGLNSYSLSIAATDSTSGTSFSNLIKSDFISLKAVASTDNKLATLIPDNAALTLTNAVPNFATSTAGVPAVSTADVQCVAAGTITASFSGIVSDPANAPSIQVNEVTGSNNLQGTVSIQMSAGTYAGITGTPIPVGGSSTATVTVTVPAGFAASMPWTAQGATLTQISPTSATLANIASSSLGGKVSFSSSGSGSAFALSPFHRNVPVDIWYSTEWINNLRNSIAQDTTITNAVRSDAQTLLANLTSHLPQPGEMPKNTNYSTSLGGLTGSVSVVTEPDTVVPASYLVPKSWFTAEIKISAPTTTAPNVVVTVPCTAVSTNVTLTVHSGSQTTTYQSPTNTTITPIPSDSISGKTFSKWIMTAGSDAILINADASTTAVRMGAKDAEMTATFSNGDSLTPTTQYVYSGPHANKTLATLQWNLPSAKVTWYPTVRWFGTNMNSPAYTPAPLLSKETSGTTTFGPLLEDQTISLRYVVPLKY